MNANRRLDDLMSLRHFLTVAIAASLIIGSQCNAAFFQQTGNQNAAEAQPSVLQRQHVQHQSGQKQQQLAGFKTQPGKNDKVKRFTLTARFHLVKGTHKGVLILKAQIPKGSYIYSVTQRGNPPPSKITVTESAHFKIDGKFTSDRHPKIIEKDPVFNVRLEKHLDLVQFFVPIELADNIDPQKVAPEIVFSGQVCSENGTCMPIRNRRVSAQFAGYFEQQAKKQAGSQNQRR